MCWVKDALDVHVKVVLHCMAVAMQSKRVTCCTTKMLDCPNNVLPHSKHQLTIQASAMVCGHMCFALTDCCDLLCPDEVKQFWV